MLSTLIERRYHPVPKSVARRSSSRFTIQPAGHGPLQALVTAKLSVEVYEALDEASRHEVVATLLSLVLTAEEVVASNSMACLTRVPIGSGMFARLLEKQQNAPQVNLSTLSGLLEVLAVQLENERSRRNGRRHEQAPGGVVPRLGVL
ncbi:hypothetical protein PsorP6_002627 [Peronosclerospora sorghi]|uniref:Uncharacterized protein n=1 Tax=Peronosclerospora sorghi TaxID=230839 RepID=A0ACC0WTM6_9STRA|nr:hypothetical protein PsorP6_002627 [Peronosclerospora sorghi]